MLKICRGKGVIRICCVCHRIIDEREALAQIEAGAKEGKGVEFTHGLCSQCFQSEMAKIEEYKFENTFKHMGE